MNAAMTTTGMENHSGAKPHATATDSAQQKFRRSLINLLSPDGGSTHQPKDGDFIWDLSFNFGPTDFPDGSTGKGTFIQCRDFYGTLRVFTAIDGKTFRCTTSEQEVFLQQVYDIVSLEP